MHLGEEETHRERTPFSCITMTGTVDGPFENFCPKRPPLALLVGHGEVLVIFVVPSSEQGKSFRQSLKRYERNEEHI